jgi:hypothetical protein
MKKVRFVFYSFIPRLSIDLTYNLDIIPRVGDEIILQAKYLEKFDKKFFPDYYKTANVDMKFKVEKIIFNFGKKPYFQEEDITIILNWTDKEKLEIEKYKKKGGYKK